MHYISFLSSTASYHNCLHLKLTFFCLWLAPLIQPLFAFQWKYPNFGFKSQLTYPKPPKVSKACLLSLEKLSQLTKILLVDLIDDTQAVCWKDTYVLLQYLTKMVKNLTNVLDMLASMGYESLCPQIK